MVPNIDKPDLDFGRISLQSKVVIRLFSKIESLDRPVKNATE